MLHDAAEPGSPGDWLRHARSDLERAAMRKTRAILYAHLCFHAQQAAEKALKAVLATHGLRVPKTHDIAYLMDLLPAGLSITPAMLDLPTLTKYAVQQRYPGENPPIARRHHARAVLLAEDAVTWATRCVGVRTQNGRGKPR